MSSASEPLWLQIARKEDGTTETAGPGSTARILEYHAATSYGAKDDETSWCSSFVNWCMKQAGIAGTNNAGARSWMNWGIPLTTPVVGCVAVFGYPDSWRGHVGLYVGEDKESIRVFGGNQGNRVCEARMSKTLLLGFRWPTNYAALPRTAPLPLPSPVLPPAPTIPADGARCPSVLVKRQALMQIAADLTTIHAQVNAQIEMLKGLVK